MTDFQKALFELQDNAYRDFTAKLIPGIDRESIIGVRTPALRALVKSMFKEGKEDEIRSELPHRYHEENLAHGFSMDRLKDYDECIRLLDEFLPYVNNWAVCDTIRPKLFKKNTDRLIVDAERWTKSEHPYIRRFGMNMTMAFLLDDAFRPEFLELPASLRSDEYYVNMMTAWLFATALAKQWDATIPYLTEDRLDRWTHNKTIQKAIESYRITPEQKDYLRTLRRKG